MGDELFLPFFCWLTAAEVERYRRFVRPERQRQFLIGRLLLRHALGNLLGVHPQAISLTERPGLAPLLNWESSPHGFSLSHSGPWIACAVSAQTALGLDIEMMDSQRDLVALGEQVFDAAEAAAISALADDVRAAAFYELWSRKEASYKLASTSTTGMEENWFVLAHPDISIVLCSMLPLKTASICKFRDW